MVLRTVRLTLLAALCIVALGALAVPAVAVTAGAGHWTWQSPLPQGGWVSDTSFIGDEGWAVTGGADVLHTTDGGVTWTDQPTGESDSLYAVHFVSALEGWAAGGWGAILHTADGGATWERQVSATLDTLSDVQFVDAEHGWMIGSASVLATTDGGATWALQLGSSIFSDWYWYGPEVMYSAGAFVDAQHGCVVGAHALQRQEEDYAGCAWITADGGLHWTRTDIPGVTSLGAVTTQGGSYWAAGAGNAIVHSADGTQWTRKTVEAPVYLEGIAMTAAGVGWAVGSGESDDWFSNSYVTTGITLKTVDGGATWDPVADPVLSGDALVSVTFDGDDDGRILAESGAIFMTHDAGDTWALVGPDRGSPVTFAALTRSPDGVLWAVGKTSNYNDYYGESGSGSGVVWRSVDDGVTWTALDDPLFEVGGFSQVYAAASGEAWVAGEGGRILHTTDGGATWQQQATGVGASLVGLAFSDSEHGWAVSAAMPGVVLKTIDGGAHWRLTTIGTRERYLSVSASGSDVWLGGMEYRSDCAEEGAGLVAHSADGGDTWTTATAGPRAVLDLQFVGGQGWALSGIPYWWDSAGRLLHTTDGATWTEVKIGPSGSVRGFRAMYFADENEGWILADGDYEGTRLLHTIDGGAHWGAITIREAWGLQALCFAGKSDGWVAGSENTILATEDGGGIAPISVANVGYTKWTNKAFTVKVTTADDGLGLAPTQTRVGSGPWEDTATRLVPAPKNHSNDGYTLVRYRGVDLAGNREEVSGALVAVDTRPPTVVARDRSRAHTMRIATLRLKVDDAMAPYARVYADVYKKSGERLRRVRGTLPTDGLWHPMRYACMFPVGTYRMVVHVRDLAGNQNARPRTVMLTVIR